jgi:CRP-like cAMP-binding protein
MAEIFHNHILSGLSASDLALLEPHLERVDLPLRKVLEKPSRKLAAAYFPETGIASVVANGATTPIEVGLIGREGMSGIALVLGGDRGTNEVYVQVAGHGHYIRAKALSAAINASVSLHRSFLRFAHAFLNQTTRTAVANGRSKVEERLARWLLMADDRLDGGELPLTQEFLAMMLGVRRSGVTIALQVLEADGVIARRRGLIVLRDRARLVKLCNGAYSDDTDV